MQHAISIEGRSLIRTFLADAKIWKASTTVQ